MSTTPIELDPVTRLTKDLAKASATLSVKEARFLVDSYYIIQEHRLATENQVRALKQSEEPHSVIQWFSEQNEGLENQVKRALNHWTDGHELGVWCKSITGIGPVLAAGLLAHIDIEKAPTAGHIWRFAGQDPTQKWVGKEGARTLFNEFHKETTDLMQIAVKAASYIGTQLTTLVKFATTDREGMEIEFSQTSLINAMARRPWNASLKTLCWKIGESFVKVSGNPKDFYGKIYLQRKEQEINNNNKLKFADQAAAILVNKRIGKNTDAYKAYSQGMLPPAHIHARAKRYAVRIFLSHYQEKAYWIRYNQAPPAPYAIAILGHAHKIEPPTQN